MVTLSPFLYFGVAMSVMIVHNALDNYNISRKVYVNMNLLDFCIIIPCHSALVALNSDEHVVR